MPTTQNDEKSGCNTMDDVTIPTMNDTPDEWFGSAADCPPGFVFRSRELTMTREAVEGRIFPVLWDMWTETRAFDVQPDWSLKQQPLSRPGYPDSREDCDVIMAETERSREGAWHPEGILLRLEWTRNSKPGCKEEPYAWLATEEYEAIHSALSPRGQVILEECRRKLQDVAWRENC